MSSATAFKICGVTRTSDALAAEAAGAAFLGANLVPESPRRIPLDVAAEIARAVSIPLVVVVADLSVPEAAAAARAAGARIIQLHGSEPVDTLEALRREGSWELWKAVRVRSPADVPGAVERYGRSADLLLLDGWHPDKLGGTGVPFDWAGVARHREGFPRELRLGIAGGLTPENALAAVAALRPDLVDVSSGVEVSPGVKDAARMRELGRLLGARPSKPRP